MPAINAVVGEQMHQLRAMAMERYRAWGERELDVTAEELEQWLNGHGCGGAFGA